MLVDTNHFPKKSYKLLDHHRRPPPPRGCVKVLDATQFMTTVFSFHCSGSVCGILR